MCNHCAVPFNHGGDKDLDAHHTDHVSQTYLSSLRVSQHPNCTVTITISNRTSSGEHNSQCDHGLGCIGE